MTSERRFRGISVGDRAYRDLNGTDMDSLEPVDALVVQVGRWDDKSPCADCGTRDLGLFSRLPDGPAICYLCMWPELEVRPKPAKPPKPGSLAEAQGALF